MYIDMYVLMDACMHVRIDLCMYLWCKTLIVGRDPSPSFPNHLSVSSLACFFLMKPGKFATSIDIIVREEGPSDSLSLIQNYLPFVYYQKREIYFIYKVK